MPSTERFACRCGAPIDERPYVGLAVGPKDGAAIPSGISLYPLPRQAARDVPAVKPYRFATLQNKVLIVNPSDKKIADVVAK